MGPPLGAHRVIDRVAAVAGGTAGRLSLTRVSQVSVGANSAADRPAAESGGMAIALAPLTAQRIRDKGFDPHPMIQQKDAIWHHSA